MHDIICMVSVPADIRTAGTIMTNHITFQNMSINVDHTVLITDSSDFSEMSKG